jgi:hypothetical protein
MSFSVSFIMGRNQRHPNTGLGRFSFSKPVLGLWYNLLISELSLQPSHRMQFNASAIAMALKYRTGV